MCACTNEIHVHIWMKKKKHKPLDSFSQSAAFNLLGYANGAAARPLTKLASPRQDPALLSTRFCCSSVSVHAMIVCRTIEHALDIYVCHPAIHSLNDTFLNAYVIHMRL